MKENVFESIVENNLIITIRTDSFQNIVAEVSNLDRKKKLNYRIDPHIFKDFSHLSRINVNKFSGLILGNIISNQVQRFIIEGGNN